MEIRLWGEQRLDFLWRFLPERGLPVRDPLNDIINGLDVELFKTCFANWVETLRDRAPDIIAIDSKTLAANSFAPQGSRAAAFGLRLGDPSAYRPRSGPRRRQV